MPIDQVIPGNKHRQDLRIHLNEPEVQGPLTRQRGPAFQTL